MFALLEAGDAESHADTSACEPCSNSLPSDAHYMPNSHAAFNTAECAWECDHGFVRQAGACVNVSASGAVA